MNKELIPESFRKNIFELSIIDCFSIIFLSSFFIVFLNLFIYKTMVEGLTDIFNVKNMLIGSVWFICFAYALKTMKKIMKRENKK